MPTELPASRARGPSWQLAGCVFCLTVTLVVIHATGAAPFVESWVMEVFAW